MRDFQSILAEDGHDNQAAVEFALDRRFNGLNFEGARVLDVGSGRGLMTLYAALHGAETVVSMEPEMDGSTEGAARLQIERVNVLQLTNVEFLSEDFNDWDGSGAQFDIVMCIDCINHLAESDHHALHHKPTYERFCKIAQKFLRLLKPGGTIVFTDAVRYGMFTALKKYGVRRPWQKRRSSLNWKIHQNPRVWKKIFMDSGFESCRIIYPLPHPLRHLGPIVANPIANFMLRASFEIHCKAQS